ncbi:hypothetical protein HAX54_042934 [Datura stramonium]|uniref:Uncharacterized protein n=1 Tax=Datura stramonium TaxID=4076 RepID=A0ABS8W3Y5_DATST|nr:hypothetical protein [Datura stramonium]
MHENFLDGYLQTLMDAAGPISIKISEVAHQEYSNAVPRTENSFTPLVMSLEQYKGKGPQLLKNTPIEQVSDQDFQGGKGSFLLSIASHVSKKRSSQGESNRNHEDRCWKKVRPHSNKLGDADLAVVEIHDSVDSPSRTLTVLIKESNGSGALPRERSQKSGESISGPNPIKSPSTGKTKKEATSAPRDRVRARLSSDLQKHPTTAVSVFDGKKVFLSYRKMFIYELWTVIQGKLSESDVDCASSLKEEVQVILDEMDGKDATEKEVEEAKLGVSTTEKDSDACSDADLLNSDDLTDLEQKKECLEAMRQDLINYKLCLD